MTMEFSDWITQKYIRWRGDAVGNDRTITEFARWLGVSQSLVTQWMQKGGKVPKSQKSIVALASRYGAEVYEVLGLIPPDSQILLRALPSEFSSWLSAAVQDIIDTLNSRGVDKDSPEASAITREVMGRWGFISTDKPGKSG